MEKKYDSIEIRKLKKVGFYRISVMLNGWEKSKEIHESDFLPLMENNKDIE